MPDLFLFLDDDDIASSVEPLLNAEGIQVLRKPLAAASSCLSQKNGGAFIYDARPEGLPSSVLNPSGVYLFDGTVENLIESTYRESNFHCFVGHNQDFFERDLAQAARYFACGKAPVPEGESLYQTKVTRYSEVHSIFDHVQHEAESMRLFNNFQDIIVTSLWEVLKNAVRSSANTLGLHYQSFDDIVLPDDKAVEVELVSNERTLSVAIRDVFGELRRDAIVNNMYRAHFDKKNQLLKSSQGAGVGLYIVLNYVHNLQFMVVPQQSSTVVFTVHKFKRQKKHDSHQRSLQIMIAPPKGG